MPVYLSEAEVGALLEPAEAISAVEAALVRSDEAAGVESSCDPVRLDGGRLTVSAGRDPEVSAAAVTAVAGFGPAGEASLALVLRDDRPVLDAIVEARQLRALRAAATSAVAARRLARSGSRTVGVIGCGLLAASHVACLREALRDTGRVVAYCRNADRLSGFCEAHAAEPAEYGRDAAEQAIVITATTSRDPVLRGDWLRPGAFVCAAGATTVETRELDNAVLERAAFVCCDALERGRVQAGDLVEPVERGVLDWLEVHELPAVVSGAIEGRQSDADIVVLKTIGSATLDLALAALAARRARERVVGSEVGV